MLLRRVIIGAGAGYVASRAMEVATSWWYERQSAESRAREERLFARGALVTTGRDVANVLRIEADDEQVLRLGQHAHRGIGMASGVLGAILVGAGVRPMRAGLLTGAVAFLLVDEALSAVHLEPAPSDFPVEAHLRGVVGHATLGVTLGALMALARPLLVRRT